MNSLGVLGDNTATVIRQLGKGNAERHRLSYCSGEARIRAHLQLAGQKAMISAIHSRTEEDCGPELLTAMDS